VLALVIAIVVMGAFALATWAFRLDRPQEDQAEDGVMDAGLALASLAFSLLAAFVVFFLAGEFREARSAVQAEAVAAESFGSGAARLPGVGPRLISETAAYLETVVEEEWPLMDTPGLESPAADAALERVFTTLLSPEEGLDQSDARFDLALNGLDHLLVAREQRLVAGRGSMSGALWFAVLATGTITAVLALLYRAGAQRWRKWLQVLATGAVLATVLFVLVMVENPYSGTFSVSRDPFDHALDALRQTG
jgi:hypothetical protein